MVTTDFHMHTTFCDGHSSPEEMVLSAINKGLGTVGLSGHSYTWFDESYCMKKQEIPAYVAEVTRLKQAYAGKINILCGVEQDYYSDEPTAGFDYVIGSVHYLKFGDEFMPVDEGNENHRRAAAKYFGGDMYALAEAYYQTVGDVVQKTNCDIIGHFDIITKYYDNDPELDVNHPRYRAAWQAAADRLIKTGVPFEMNTGAISRGVRQKPYPSEEILAYLAERNAPVILSSDAHHADYIAFQFDQCEATAKELGVKLVSLAK